MLKSRTQFIPKSDGKLRPLSIVGRFSALIEYMVSIRLEKLISGNKHYKNRFGFLKARSIEDIQNQLNDQCLISKKLKVKSALIALDQSSAFNLVSHMKLCIKLFDLVKTSGDVTFYSVCLGFSTRWLGEGRRLTIFKRSHCKVWRGVPQGPRLYRVVCSWLTSTLSAGLMIFWNGILLMTLHSGLQEVRGA